MRKTAEAEHIIRQKQVTEKQKKSNEKTKQLNLNIQSIMRLPLETKHQHRRKYRNKHASICRTTLCLFLAGSACSAKEEGELQIGWSLSWLLLLTLSFACYKAKDAAKQLIHFPFDEGKSHRPFGTITKCDGKVTRIRLYLVVCNKACEANTKEVPLSESDDQMR